ncbi:hypothetical protein CEXT_337471 [Caerostris extrusa]|uniref:Uncharacterized protein n=1 Tax=Caerostris extrusa TaxID=172846 RepID=A0AAV4Q3T3_CAEEX|nr:hypothetical protein CEXT_337471 [Caerostris extrusa]
MTLKGHQRHLPGEEPGATHPRPRTRGHPRDARQQRGQRPLLRGGGAGALRGGAHRRAHSQVPADRTLRQPPHATLRRVHQPGPLREQGGQEEPPPHPAVDPQGTQGGRAEAEPRGQDGQSEFVV